MMIRTIRFIHLSIVLLSILCQHTSGQNSIPHLQKIGNRFQLIVHDKPFLMLAGELGNSTASTMESMEKVWPKLKKLKVNTVLVPIFWELMEPEEGKYDFRLISQLVHEARTHDLKLVILWFGSWKNSMSSHVPSWVKLDQDRFPRAKSHEGISQEILTPFSEENLKADINAYKALMRHIKTIDANHHTVILMQPENEIGMLPSARDHHPLANTAFQAQVPEELVDYLVEHKSVLNPEFKSVWAKNGYKTQGDWETIFGKGLHTDEIFMAYYYTKYADRITAAGKAAYNLPAFVNAALNRPGRKPGEYPSAGPLPHILDVWQAAAPNIDFYAPDFYNPRFMHWCDLYVRQGNPLFVPEHRFDHTVAAKALYTIGHYEGLGFSPFSIEQSPDADLTQKEKKLAEVYKKLADVKLILDKCRGQGRVEGVLLGKEDSESVFQLGDYEFTARHTHTYGWEPQSNAEEWELSGAVIIQTDVNEFYYIGFGVALTFKHLNKPEHRVGILKAEKGYFKDGSWVIYQHLNGDQTHQGRHIRSFVDDISIQRFTLYEYR